MAFNNAKVYDLSAKSPLSSSCQPHDVNKVNGLCISMEIPILAKLILDLMQFQIKSQKGFFSFYFC